MTTIGVTAWQVRYQDPNVNSDKFYRCYALDNGKEIHQYGRRGTRGTIRWTTHPSGIMARNSAEKKIYEKQHKGYWDAPGRFVFSAPANATVGQVIDLADAQLAQISDPQLAQISDPPPPIPPSTGSADASSDSGPASLESITDRALEALALIVDKPEEGYVAFAELQTDWAELEERVARARGYLDTLEELMRL